MSPKIAIFALLVIGANCRSFYERPHFYITDQGDILRDDIEDVYFRDPREHEDSEGLRHVRVARQVQGVGNTNPDGSYNFVAKAPLAGNDKNVLSAIGSVSGLKKNGEYGSAGGGLALDNVNGHGLSLTGSHLPNFGNQLTAAGKLNLLHTPDHNLNANAFITRNMPSIPNLPNFNTKGGSIDYTFKDRLGASLGVQHTDLFKKTDYSAMGNLNLFKDRTSSLDFNAGMTKSVSPFIPRSSWQPSAGLTFSKYW